MKILKKIVYNPAVSFLLKLFLSIFYDKKYLSGKFFEKYRAGYWWALKGIPRRISLSRQHVKWPVGKRTEVLDGNNIHFDSSSLNIFQQPGCYYQGFASIEIGKDVWIAQNVGIITANHDLKDPEKHSEGKPVKIGDRCWIGMNAIILPGVTLGDNTVVGAGAVVTRSFPEGHCVIGGNPARKIKDI